MFFIAIDRIDRSRAFDGASSLRLSLSALARSTSASSASTRRMTSRFDEKRGHYEKKFAINEESFCHTRKMPI
jgi:hypothetical protein